MNCLHASLDHANQDFLLAADLLVLEDHPADPEIVNGICMNQGTYALALVQSLSDLDAKAQQMAAKDSMTPGQKTTLPHCFNTEKIHEYDLPVCQNQFRKNNISTPSGLVLHH
jgi:hypothetical protein